MLDLTFRNQPGTGPAATAAGHAGVAPTPAAGAQPAVPPPARSTPRPGSNDIHGIEPAFSVDRAVGTLALVAVGAVIVTGLIASFLVAQNQGEAERRSDQATQLHAQLLSGETGAALADIQTVSRQLTTFRAAVAAAPPWPELLTSFSELVPGSLQLTSAAFSSQDTIRIDGEAQDYQAIAQFVAALRGSETFPNPQLANVSLNESTDGTSVTFSLTTSYRARAVGATSAVEEAADAQ